MQERHENCGDFYKLISSEFLTNNYLENICHRKQPKMRKTLLNVNHAIVYFGRFGCRQSGKGQVMPFFLPDGSRQLGQIV